MAFYESGVPRSTAEKTRKKAAGEKLFHFLTSFRAECGLLRGNRLKVDRKSQIQARRISHVALNETALPFSLESLRAGMGLTKH